ncbi:MAG TPA: energy transducer TonB [Gemmatimonadaceae bacterium]|nr:energy transducer TonB [Gemmatimonadaceae bacterium]
MARRITTLVAALACARGAAAQQVRADTAGCDSIIAAARVDSVASALYIDARRSDGGEIADAQIGDMITAIASHFVPPRPFQMSVFAGPPRSRLLRAMGDTIAQLRPPTLTGVYRFTSDPDGNIVKDGVARASLVQGLDSAMLHAIRDAAEIKSIFVAADDDDSMAVDVRLSTDSIAGSRRMLGATLPRMPVHDAVPLATNPAPEFPPELLKAGIGAGEVVFRFVVGRDGFPTDDTIELVRGTSTEFIRAAMAVFPRQQFRPATIDGCAVPQLVDYSFAFIAPETPPGR